jgi:hypothetical protein
MAKSETTKSAPKEWPGAFNAFSVALDRLMKINKPAILILGVTLVLSAIDVIVFDKGFYDKDLRLSDLLYFIFLLAIPTYALAIADNKQVTAADVMRFTLIKYVIMLATVLLTILIVVGSLLLLIVPLIWTLAWFYFGTYVVIDKPMGPIEALKESKRLASQHKAKVWGIIGVSILVSIGASVLGRVPVVGDVALAAGSLWAAASSAILYRWLQKQPKEA